MEILLALSVYGTIVVVAWFIYLLIIDMTTDGKGL